MASRRRQGDRIGPLGGEREAPVDAAQRIYGTVRRVRLDEIRIVDSVQVRVDGLDEERVERYTEFLLAGGTFKDAIVVYQDGPDLILAAGFHRCEAYRRALERFEPSGDAQALAPLMAEIRTGGLDGAIEWAEEDNLTHGLELSTRDKRNILERRLKRGHAWATLSNRALAAKLGVHHDTVAVWRRETEAAPGGNPPPVRVGKDGKTYDVSGIQAANQRRAEERQAQDEPGKTAQANAKLAAKIDELREAVLAVVKGRAPMTYREIEFAVNAYLGRIANPGMLTGAIYALTRNGSLRSVGGGRYALGAAEAEPVQQNGSDWLDTPVERGATPAMAIAANGAPSDNRYQMGEPEPEATGWLDQPVERETPGVAQRDNTSIEYESDEAMAARLAELLRVGSHVLCDLEDVLEQTAPVPEWVLSKLDDLSKLLHGHPGQDDVWNPGLNSLLADLNTRSRRERE